MRRRAGGKVPARADHTRKGVVHRAQQASAVVPAADTNQHSLVTPPHGRSVWE